MISLLFSFRQKWQNVLFLHYPLKPEILQARLPAQLIPDTIDGQAWLSVVPFSLTYWIPGLPYPFRFLELNLRTYVKPSVGYQENASGVYFFCLDANDTLSVEIARMSYHLNYFRAVMSMNKNLVAVSARDQFQFQSRRADFRANPAHFDATYASLGTAYESSQHQLQQWLTQRYRLYTTDKNGRLYTALLEHATWQWEGVEVNITKNTLLQAHGFEDLSLCDNLSTFSKELSVIAHPSRRCQ